ncbi:MULTISPECIES: hypothetical protein [unclassified Tolypothrix]|nr:MULTISPECIES: hypothetical protein [unclassified Tolypothrix]MBE9084523.1 hypothetical protein [Tolypothrix sp. LEGE 11397]UYD29162.1 hypothetical protein HGR01_14645 [Tolypothrix sp. PCC 7712]UYD34925.1 hypothetical protein HG267_03690 [Tolypothrix sp. PCC 7601]
MSLITMQLELRKSAIAKTKMRSQFFCQPLATTLAESVDRRKQWLFLSK